MAIPCLVIRCTPIDATNIVTPDIGQIVMSDGSFLSTNSYDSYSGSAIPVGIVCHVNNDGITGLMVGLKNSNETGYRWAPYNSFGELHNFTEIQGTSYDGDIDGSDNWEVICNEDPSGSANSSIKYPVFNYVINYPLSANILNTNYSDNWYMPSEYELYNYIYINKGKINKGIQTVGGVLLGNEFYWSSTQYISDGADALYVCFINGGRGHAGKFVDYSVCCLHSF